MLKYFTCSFIVFALISCSQPEEKQVIQEDSTPIELNLKEANRLSKLPLKCMDTEYPNRLGQTLSGEEDLQSPKQLHPAFYGCFDWHSSVHGHWMLVNLLKQFPDLENKDSIKQKLIENLSKENILAEVHYLEKKYNKTYERTYGWAWLLKLSEELYTWNDSIGKELALNLQPLTDLIAFRYMEFLPKLNYPLRVGMHSNTCFGLSFAWDYAKAKGMDSLKMAIEERSKDFFLSDENYPISWEPNGYDFLSPALEELDLMRRVLSKEEFKSWVSAFLPQLSDPEFIMEPGVVSDREDGLLVHLDGLNFSRAWCLYGVANNFEEYKHLRKLADDHIRFSLPSMVDGAYEGEHWLASFALYALNESK